MQFILTLALSSILLWHQYRISAFRCISYLRLTNRRGSAIKSTISEEDTQSVLKIPESAWKFPQSWPFPEDFLKRLDEYEPKESEYSTESSFLRHLKAYITESDSILCIGDRECDEESFRKTFPNASFLDIRNMLSGDEELQYPSASFDRIVLYSGVEVVENPLSLFREICRVMKPNGKGFVCFASTPRVPSSIKPVTMWKTMTDEQKIWIAGSYFHYGAAGVWDNIKGFDILGNTGKEEMKFEKEDGPDQLTAFIVQSSKKPSPELASSTNDVEKIAEYIKYNLAGTRNLDSDAILFLSYRLASRVISGDFFVTKTDDFQQTIQHLSSIYDVLKNVKEVVLPSPIKAMLAVSLLDKWDNSNAKMSALRSGLGLDPPDESFWKPISSYTNLVKPKEKIFFLADVVNEFEETPSDKLQQLPELMRQALDILEKRMVSVPEEKRQSFVADIVISDFLLYSAPSVPRVLAYLEKTSTDDLNTAISSMEEIKSGDSSDKSE